MLGDEYDKPYGSVFHSNHHLNAAWSVAGELLNTTAQKVKEKHAKGADIESGSFRIVGQGRVEKISVEEQAKRAVSGRAKEITVTPAESGTTITGMGTKQQTKKSVNK